MKRMPCFALVLLLAASGCTKDPVTPDILTPNIPAVAGVYVMNEGNYGDASGARLSLFVPKTDTVYHSLVEGANGGAHMGSTGDDCALFRGKLYLLMSGSENLMVLSSVDHTILQNAYYPGSTPHAMLIDSTRNVIYIARLYKSSIMILNLQSLAVVDSVGVGANPQQMALAGGNLYVCNSGYGADNRVTVINPDTRSVVTQVRVGDGPTGIVLGSDGKLWVSCTGNAFGMPASYGSIHRINPSTNARVDSVAFTEALWGDLVAGGNGYIYALGTTPGSYYGGPVHRIAVSSLAVTPAFIAGTYYGIGLDDATGDLYLGDAKSFNAAGDVRIYSSDAALKKIFTAERGPTLFMFKR